MTPLFFQRLNSSPWMVAFLSLAAGALITLSFAPFDYWFIGLIALSLFACLLHQQSLRSVIWRSFGFGVGLYAAGVHWIYVSIHNFGGASPLLAGALVLIFACFMSVVFCAPFYIYGRWFNRHKFALILALPLCWLLGEWLRTWLLTGFPWLFIGYGHLNTWLAGWAPITGVLGVSTIAVFTAAVISQAIINLDTAERKARTNILLPALCGLLFWFAGNGFKNITWAAPSEQAITVGMVQPNIDQSIKLYLSPDSALATLDQLRSMSEEIWHNDWVIWPEAAVPNPLTYHTALPFLEEINTIAAQHQTALFTGIIFDEKKLDQTRYYNSIAGLGEGLGFYHKRRLVPFGEYVPLDNYVRGLIEFFDLPTSFINLGPSEQHGLIAHGIRITPAICYEIVYPDLIAQSAKETQVLLNVNNLGWFLDSIQSKQFMQMAQMRALETGRYLIYSTNNGPSAIIDNKGKIQNQSESFKTQTFNGTIYPVKDWTPFMIMGSWPLAALGIFVLLGMYLLARKAR